MLEQGLVAKTVSFEAAHRVCGMFRPDRSYARADRGGGSIKEKIRKEKIAKVGKQNLKPGHSMRAKRGGGYVYIYIFYVYCIDKYIIHRYISMHIYVYVHIYMYT